MSYIFSLGLAYAMLLSIETLLCCSSFPHLPFSQLGVPVNTSVVLGLHYVAKHRLKRFF